MKVILIFLLFIGGCQSRIQRNVAETFMEQGVRYFVIKDIETGQNTNIALNTIEVFDFDGKKLFWYSGHFSKSESSADRIPYGLIAKQCMGVTNDYGEILCFAKPLVKGKKYIFAPSIEGAPYIRDIENLIFVH